MDSYCSIFILCQMCRRFPRVDSAADTAHSSGGTLGTQACLHLCVVPSFHLEAAMPQQQDLILPLHPPHKSLSAPLDTSCFSTTDQSASNS